MAPLVTLLATFAVAWALTRYRPDRTLAGRVALAVMLFVTASAHFFDRASLVAMVPSFVPARAALVYATGAAELLFAVALLARPRPWLGWVLAAFFVALLPANVYSALAGVGLGGHGPGYLLFRVPLQLLFIAWALIATKAVRWPRGRHRGAPSGDPLPAR
jgi:uncharacterized membrane protein